MIIVYYLSVLFEWGGLIAKDGITLLRRAFVRMLHAALAFSACYYRLLRSNGTISREIKLLPVEFMVAITLYLVGIAVTPFARKDLQIVG